MSNKKYKTKFPVADEEIGKMTANTPILISAALELFIKSIVLKTLEEARAKKAPRIALCHLKRCINNNEKFDFLKDLVENVADPIDNHEEKPPSKPKLESSKVKKSLPTGLGAKYQRKKPIEEDINDSESLPNQDTPKFDPIRHIHTDTNPGYDYSFKLATAPTVPSHPVFPTQFSGVETTFNTNNGDGLRPLQPRPAAWNPFPDHTPHKQN